METAVGDTVVLCINSGSSSVKFAVYAMAQHKEEVLLKGAVENIGTNTAIVWLKDAQGKSLLRQSKAVVDHQQAMRLIIALWRQQDFSELHIVGHRVVHGGSEYNKPQLVTPTVLQTLKRLVDFAPLHMPGAIEGIEAVGAHIGEIPQVACFDTAFHRSMPLRAQRYPLPASLWEEGVRRYGFHGLSYEYILQELGHESRGRLVIAHLGNGASMAAVEDGVAMDTTMGFTPTGGLMMGTRCGELDPGVIMYLLKHRRYEADALNDLLNQQSGLLGVSSLSADVKTLLDYMPAEPLAKLALDMFCYYARKHIGALVSVLSGVDRLVFTGGIGERSAIMRQWICEGLGYLGIQLDEAKNTEHARVISSGACTVNVIPTNEDLMIARHAYKAFKAFSINRES
jgi:acetate kinase